LIVLPIFDHIKSYENEEDRVWVASKLPTGDETLDQFWVWMSQWSNTFFLEGYRAEVPRQPRRWRNVSMILRHFVREISVVPPE
jgi:hypothetical protein